MCRFGETAFGGARSHLHSVLPGPFRGNGPWRSTFAYELCSTRAVSGKRSFTEHFLLVSEICSARAVSGKRPIGGTFSHLNSVQQGPFRGNCPWRSTFAFELCSAKAVSGKMALGTLSHLNSAAQGPFRGNGLWRSTFAFKLCSARAVLGKRPLTDLFRI